MPTKTISRARQYTRSYELFTATARAKSQHGQQKHSKHSMEDRTPRPYASSDEDFEMVADASGTLTLTAAAELSHVATTNARATVACNITAAASEGKRRPDVDVVVVMDRSGSMEAER